MGEAAFIGGGGGGGGRKMLYSKERDVEVVDVDDEEEEEGGGGLKWQQFLPRMVLRVLLVEADDSTRQIIAALLRKCSYRVSAVPDGLKAWELLKGRPRSIDLILTEVDLPAISGFALLTLIMEHEICKNIPVIMMSSHDAVSTVYSCMLRGAADYLVKPIRKNELKNLWQHVWRRQSSSSSGNGNGNGQQDETVALQKVEAMAENNGASNNSSGYLACVERDKELIEKGSDAQSSCTKPELEVDVAETEQTPYLPQPGCENNIKLGLCRRDGKGFIGTGLSSHDDATANPVREVINLIETFDNQTVSGRTSNCCIKGSDLSPDLDLSLRRSDSGGFVSPKTGERGTLKHSDASAFSRYVNKSLNPMQPGSTIVSLQQKECGSNWDTIQHAAVHRESDVPILAPSTPTSKISLAAARSRQSEFSRSCSQQNVFPAPSPRRGMQIYSPSKEYGSAFPKVCHAQYGSSPMTSPSTVGRPEPLPDVESIRLLNYENNHIDRSDDPVDQNGSIPTFRSHHHKQELKLNHLEDCVHISSGTDRSASGSFCNGTSTRLNSSEGGSICASNGNVSQTPVAGHAGENGHCFVSQDGIANRSMLRAAALAKFRMKRKDRCFEKKVRYESRKKLAEQRPRVKGQFVRQVPADSTPGETNW
ncbi:hypothetical protein MLD38_030459 [Melastoma candidum]|uniref:Uncharacterized protein n=1 Tax=Melastoma candidum TaxID=119954 RepID=A0ACB9MLU1_9MYRT|nr:hypothetical protein MLD38_030459 [Melastoma candidum]